MDDVLDILEANDDYLPDVDGVVNCVHNYCLNLSKHERVTVMAPRGRKSYKEDLPYRTIRCNSAYIPFLRQHYGFPETDRDFKKKLAQERYDIIHIHSPFNIGKFAVKTARSKGIPVVGTYHSNMRMIFECFIPFPLTRRLILKNIGNFYNQLDEVFVCSPKVGEQLSELGYTGKVTYLPFGTDFEKCRNVEELSRKANEVFGLGAEEPVFVYIGRIQKLKRIDFILRSLRIVKERGFHFRFFAVGKGMELEPLKRLAKQLGFTEEEVCFTGYLPREQLPLLSARADLLLFPSLYDNFGLVKLECASYETAGVFIEDSCAGDGITHGVNGFLSKDDEDAFAQTILEAAADYGRLKEIGKKAQEDLFITWEQCSEILLENYRRIIREYRKKD